MEIGQKRIALDDSRVISFRPTAPEDEPFLQSVYGSTRLEELALTNWSEEQRNAFIKMQFNAQQIHYREYYPSGEQFIILADGNAVGRLYVAEIEKEIRILDITVLPERRSAGIGTPIIRELMNEATRIGKPLRIYVESYNRSRGLFERLGFVKSGESGYSYLMEWRGERPAAAREEREQ
ncbi:MAG TPA: GNAT family N-acetyltransferase [Blastocatellia bacterium]|nr:GNAT family N-acetyltransferase [Blastocatellia bacterium]